MAKKTISLLLIFMMIFTIALPINAFGTTNDYEENWAGETIQSWLDDGYITGYSDGSFKPEKSVTRAEFVKMVNNVFNYTDKSNINFSDVDKNGWYYEEIQKAYKAGYIDGISKTKFNPNGNLTREQAAVIICKIKKLSSNSKGTEIFTDKNKISVWAQNYVGSAVLSNLIKGYNDSTFKPQNNINRAEAVVTLSRTIDTSQKKSDLTEYRRVLQSVNKSNYTDESWAVYNSIVQLNIVNANNTQKQVDEATSVIKKAQNDLIIRPLPIKILTIGNSFSEDATSQIYDIAKSAGVDVIVGNLYIAGCSLQTHWNNAVNNNNAYTYYKWTSPLMTTTKYKTMKDAVLDEDWDFITFQQVSGYSGLYSTYQPYLNNLVNYVKGLSTNINNTDVKLALNMPWAYADDSTHENFVYYSNNQLIMYYSIINSYKKAAEDSGIDIVIPSGTAVQNGRSNEILHEVGDELTRDGYHLNLGIGRYIASLTLFETLIINEQNVNKDLFSDVTYIPNTSNPYYAYLAKVAVMNAVKNPFKITVN